MMILPRESRRRHGRSLKLKRMLRFLLVAGIVLSASVLCSAQQISNLTVPSSSTSVQQDSELLKLLEVTKIQRDGFEQQVKLRDERLAAKDDRLTAKDEIIVQLRQQLADAQANRKDQGAINTGDARLLKACEGQLVEANNEIQRLRNPSFLSRLFKPDVLIAAGGGFFLGRATAPSQGFIQITNPFQQFAKGYEFSLFQVSPEERVKQAFKVVRNQ